MLYQAIFIPQGQHHSPARLVENLNLGNITKILVNPRLCLVAEKHQQLMGAIWIRLFDAQTKVTLCDAETPEVSMAVLARIPEPGQSEAEYWQSCSKG
jgi:hypothetical protein